MCIIAARPDIAVEMVRRRPTEGLRKRLRTARNQLLNALTVLALLEVRVQV